MSTGIIRQLTAEDYVCSTYRDHVHALSKDVPPKEIMAELFGKKTGICRGQGGSMHMFSKKHGLVGLWLKWSGQQYVQQNKHKQCERIIILEFKPESAEQIVE